MTEVHARELSKEAMAAGNEAKYQCVIDNGQLKEWVGIGWIELREASPSDYEYYPTVERDSD